MTRPLTPGTAAEAAATATTPICILEIAFDGAVGTRYYAGRDLGAGDGSSPLDAEGRVAAWGPIARLYSEGTVNPVGDCRITLHDADRTLKGYFDTVGFQGKRVTVYQYFAGLAENDLQPILAGVVSAPVRWREADATCTFDITDLSTRHRKSLGTAVTADDLPFVSRADEGRVVPLVFGSVARSPMICCQGGVVTELVRDCTAEATKLFVNDAGRFPQGETIRIRVDDEVIEGTFGGNAFNVSQRGCDILAASTTTAARDERSFYDRTLSDTDGTYRGYFLKVTDPDQNVRYRQILRYSGEEHCLEYFPRILLQDGSEWTIPAGTAYGITSWARSHRTGARVVYHDTSYTFIVNDAPSKRVRAVEGYGTFAELFSLADADTAEEAWARRGRLREGWSLLDPGTYTVNTCDTGIYGPDHPVTTVTFGRHPEEIFPSVRALSATLDGVEDAGDGTGELIEDPALVIRELLERFVGVPAEEMDADSFDQASSDGTQYLTFGFTLTEIKHSLALAADLAFQARCALLWEDGRVRLQFLRNRLDAAALTLDTSNVAADSLEVLRTPAEAVVSEVRGRFTERGEPATVIARDAAVEALYGRRVRDIALWAYAERESAASVAGFWLERWKQPWQRVRLQTYLPALALQRRDVVALDWAAFFDAGQKARVVEVHHAPGSGEPPAIDTVALTLELPLAPGCSTTCETACETGTESGCYTACEAAVQSCWQCETACEDACELFCTTEAQIGCVSNDAGCGDACETECQAYCESACETGCEVSCETGCEVSCETGCEVSCETGCETDCETGCETSCETGCETGAECTYSISDEFTRTEDPLNSDYTQYRESGTEYIRADGDEAVLDGSTGEVRHTYAIYNTPPCEADHASEVTGIVLPDCDSADARVWVCCRVSTPADPESDDMYFGLGVKTTPEAYRYRQGIEKFVNGVKTNLLWQSTTTPPTSIRLTVNGTNLGLFWNGYSCGGAEDQDISATGYVGFALGIDEQTGNTKVSEFNSEVP